MCTIVLIGCVRSVQEEGGGSKKPENLGTYIMDAPLEERDSALIKSLDET